MKIAVVSYGMIFVYVNALQIGEMDNESSINAQRKFIWSCYIQTGKGWESRLNGVGCTFRHGNRESKGVLQQNE